MVQRKPKFDKVWFPNINSKIWETLGLLTLESILECWDLLPCTLQHLWKFIWIKWCFSFTPSSIKAMGTSTLTHESTLPMWPKWDGLFLWHHLLTSIVWFFKKSFYYYFYYFVHNWRKSISLDGFNTIIKFH